MGDASLFSGSEFGRTSPRRRAASLIGAIIVHLLLLALLLHLAPPWQVHEPSGSLHVVDLPPAPEREIAHKAAKAAKKSGGAPAKTAAAILPPPTKSPTPNAPAAPWVLNPELQNFNLSQVPHNAPVQTADASQGTGAGKGQDSGSGDEGGGAPGGGRLYAADWYREPTSAELDTYMPRNHPVGWGEVACRTVERFHVEDCREIGQSPPGSGLSRAVREAAWQFLVRPPRVNGKSMIGSWVRIRITYYDGGQIGVGGGG